MKKIYLELITLTILFSLLSAAIPKYKNSNLKKFLSKLGLPDVPKRYQSFISEDDEKSDKVGEEPTEEDENEEENENHEEEKGKEDEDEDEDEDENESHEEEKEGEEEQDEKDKESEKEEDEKEEEEEKKDDKKEEEPKKDVINVKCLWVHKYDVYSLQELQNKDNDYEKEIPNGKVIFNFCQNTKIDPQSTVVWYNNQTSKFISVAGSVEGDGDNKNDWNTLNGEEGLYIELSHPKEKECRDGKYYHKTTLEIVCDPDIEDKDFLDNITLADFDKDSCEHTIRGYSIYGCPLNDWYLLKRLMNNYKFLFGIGFFLIGLFLCMFGNKFKTPTIILLMGLIFCYVISIIFLNFLSFLIKTQEHLLYLLGAGFLIGGFIGFVLRAKLTLFTILLGISMGYSFAEIVYQFVQGFIEWNPQYLYYATIGVCCIAGIFVGFLLVKTVFILGTSLLGGYVGMRGVSVIFGNYMDEGIFADLIKNGEYEQLKEIRSGWTYAYLGLWLVLTLFGVYYQCIGYKKEKATSKDNDYKKVEDKKK